MPLSKEDLAALPDTTKDSEQCYTMTYNDTDLIITWNIEKAKAFVKAGNVAISLEVPREQMLYIINKYPINEDKVANANPEVYGIAAPVWDFTTNPKRIVFTIIDGLHRAVNAYRSNKRFSCWVLPAEVSKQCVMYSEVELPSGEDVRKQYY